MQLAQAMRRESAEPPVRNRMVLAFPLTERASVMETGRVLEREPGLVPDHQILAGEAIRVLPARPARFLRPSAPHRQATYVSCASSSGSPRSHRAGQLERLINRAQWFLAPVDPGDEKDQNQYAAGPHGYAPESHRCAQTCTFDRHTQITRVPREPQLRAD
jgi:hypothetical protein